MDPKPAALYFLKYLKNGYLETKSERLLNVLKEFISETKLINLEEKKKLLINDDEINNNNVRNIDDSLNQNMGEQEKEEKINNNNDIIDDKNNIYNEDGEQEENENEEDKKEIEIKNISLNNRNDNLGHENNIKNNMSLNNKKDNFVYESNNDINNNIERDEEQKQEIYNNKNNKEFLNNNDNSSNNINIDSISLKIKHFQDKLNNIPSQEKEKETTITGSEEKKKKDEENSFNIKENSNNKNNDMPIFENNKLNKVNINEEKDKMNKSKIDDLQKIEDSIRLMSKRLDNTLNKMNEVSHRNKNARKANISTNNSINSNQGNINNLNSNINSINISKISESNNNNASIMTSESFIKNNFINFNSNTNNKQNNNKEIIEELINVIKGEINKINIYQNTKIYFQNLSSEEEKMEFSKNLRNSLENPIYLNKISINNCTNLFDFILSILSFQILNQSNNEEIIVSLQATAEYLLPFRNINDMFKILLFLLKKYFPKNLNNKIEDLSLIMIKVISYLLKELLKRLNNENVSGKEIICEINDLFTVTPPSTLTTATPNALFYQKIFTLLKSITDQIIHNNKNELINIIQYLQENKIVCEDYIQYLIRLQKNLNS